MHPEFVIQPIGNAWSPQIVGLILPIQQLEFRVPTTLEGQPDLLDIDGAYHATGGGFWGALVNGQPLDALSSPSGPTPVAEALIDDRRGRPDAQLAGTIGLIAIGRFGVIRKMFVHKNYRGKPYNLAQRLLDALLLHAQTNGIENLYLGTIHTMEAAARFYTRNGFVRIDKPSLPPGFPLMSVDDTFYHRNAYL